VLNIGREQTLKQSEGMLQRKKTRMLCSRKEGTARCSVFLPTPNDSSIVIYIHWY